MDETKSVPKLRFSGFNEGWESTKIGEIAKIVGGGTPKTEVEEYWNGEIKWFTPSEIGKTKYILDSGRHITEEGLKNSSAKLLPANTILLSSRATVGEISIALTECSTNQGFQSLITNNNVDNDFVYYLISTIKNEFIRRASGSTFLEISKNEIKRIPITIPTLSEQKKISNLFSAIDNKIEILQKKYQYYRDFKKYLMQQIFAQKLRFGFDDEWKEIKLNEVLKERKNYAKINEYPHVTLSKEGIHPKTERYNRNFLVKDDNKKYKITHFGDICYNPANLKFGVITMNKFGTAIFSPIYITFEVNNINKEFLAYYLIRNDFINKVRRFEEGTVYERMAVKPSDFLNERIFIPTLQEQEKIADLLLNVDLKIEAIKNQLTDVIKFKKGLLQQMFDNMPLLFKFNIIINE